MKRSDPAISELKSLLQALIHPKTDLPEEVEIIDEEDTRCAVFRSGGLFGYADLDCREVLLAPIYLDATPFREGLAVVRTPAGYCVIDRSGACRLDCRGYSYVGPFCDGRAVVCREELFGIYRQRRQACCPVALCVCLQFQGGPCGCADRRQVRVYRYGGYGGDRCRVRSCRVFPQRQGSSGVQRRNIQYRSNGE